tara:strand:+ start:425 stop:736 length:312 start_codon:yes stop_codon:yes gene_type:complete
MVTYAINTNNINFGYDGTCALDYGTFKKQHNSLPGVGDLLSVKQFEKGVGYIDTTTWQVNSKPIYDNREESAIRKAPHISDQVHHGHAGHRIHRVVFTDITLY